MKRHKTDLALRLCDTLTRLLNAWVAQLSNACDLAVYVARRAWWEAQPEATRQLIRALA